jgi:prepilin-type N-terminal cleavage/methylation domain-containing protein
MKKEKGFTLVELVIAITIAGIAAATIGAILLGTVKAWTFKFNRSDILWDGRLAINRMTREIRTVRDSVSVTTASSSQFRFIDAGNVDITYSLSSTNLNRTENGTANLLAENVSSLGFTYYDAAGTVIPSPTVSPTTDIKRVRINLTLIKNGQTLYLQSDSMPRNF